MASYYKRGKSYVIRVSCGYDASGKQIYSSMTWKPDDKMTPRQVEKELARQVVLFEEKCKSGYQTGAIKFETFAEEWFDEYARINLRNTTYRWLLPLRKRIYASIGHLRMDKITPRQIQAFINSLSKDGANEITGKPLAPKTIRHNLSLISDIFGYAVKMGVVSDNPCSKVPVPKCNSTEKKIYTVEEITKLLQELRGEPLKYQAFFNLAAFSGFRRGELLGLEWKDIDFESCVISIRRTSCYTAKDGTYTDTTKTRKSQRSMKFPTQVIDILKRYKDEQTDMANKLGSKWVDTDRLFVKWNGEPMRNNTPYAWLNKFCKKHGLPFYGVHSFRHQYVKYTTKKYCVFSELFLRSDNRSSVRKSSEGYTQFPPCYSGTHTPVLSAVRQESV